MRLLGLGSVVLLGATALVACGGADSASGNDGTSPDGGPATTPTGTGTTILPDGGVVPSTTKATATDGIKNGDESDVDCGGSKSKTPRCVPGKSCLEGHDCDSVVCKDAKCTAASSDDGVQNGAETDVDCGAPNGKKCKKDQRCFFQTQCESSICLNGGVDGDEGTCEGSSFADGIKNGDESDIDCGGALLGGAPRCLPSQGCGVASDCNSNVCTGSVCQSPKPDDGAKNGDETDVDCGGSGTPPCAVGLGCAAVGDAPGTDYGSRCAQLVCTAGVCQTATYMDGKKNGTETDLDCGGGTPGVDPRCAVDKTCTVKADCGTGADGQYECVGAGPKKCAEPGANDGIKNNGETDIDCGGTKAPKCLGTKACLVNTDCESGTCKGDKTCSTASHADGIKNLGETGVDCGGTQADPTSGLQAPRCSAGIDCAVDADCKKAVKADGTEIDYTTRVCNDAKKCAAAPSCRRANGGYTCGAKGAAEDCCVATTLPAKPAVKLDRYKITAGRMREFVASINADPLYNGDIEAWYVANRANFPAAVRAQLDVIDAVTGQRRGMWLPKSNGEYPRGSLYTLGGKIFHTNKPSGVQGCYVGNAGSQGYGQHTYFNGGAESDDRGYTQAYLDTLILDCSTMPMFAAFCAWDGGRLQLDDEHVGLWDAANLATSGGAVYNSGTATWTIVGPGTSGFTNTACPACDVTFANWRNSYEQPENATIRDYVNPNYAKIWDEAYKMSVPGRFRKDKGKASEHYDVHGGGIEYSATFDGDRTATVDANETLRSCASDRECIWKCDIGGTNKCVAGTVTQEGIKASGGSQEGHGLKDRYGGGSFTAMSKYGRSAGRCARD